MEYRVIRSCRKTVAIQITPAGEILVRCPMRMSQREIRNFVAEKSRWIAENLPRSPVRKLTEAELDDLVSRAKQILPPRTAFWADRIGISYGRITVRCQHTRWGSCSSKGNLSFNCLLMLMPEEVMDYVIVHELCHRKHMNHSAAFWEEVARFLPDHAAPRQWLRQHGTELIARIP